MLLTANDEGCKKSRETAGTWRPSPPCDSYSHFTLDDSMPNAWVLCRVGAFPWNATHPPTHHPLFKLNMTKIKGVDFWVFSVTIAMNQLATHCWKVYISTEERVDSRVMTLWYSLCLETLKPSKRGFWGPQWTSTHQHTIHWMPIIAHLWMNLNWVNLWFALGDQFCRK